MPKFWRQYCLLKPLIAFYYVSFFQDPVEATRRAENATVVHGGVKVFSCPVDGNPEPEIEWYSEKSGRKISCGRQLEEKESGCYTCVASNTIGTPVSITQCLVVGESVMFVSLWPFCTDKRTQKFRAFLNFFPSSFFFNRLEDFWKWLSLPWNI